MTPETIDAYVEMLLQKMKAEFDPVFLDVQADPDALPLECIPNVLDRVNREGGRIIYGWQIWNSLGR